MAELSFTLHSVFIGLACGVVSDSGLRALLVALTFHQFFEGVSLGARLAESALPAPTDVAFTAVFALSAPLGIATGVGVVSTAALNVNGATFLIAQGTFDSICAGILLQIGFSMLIKDLPDDLAAQEGEGAHLRRAALFAAVWVGACAMAYIGAYL
jgi:zinc transporter 1/2/3